MYSKVALTILSIFILSACGNSFGPKPKKPNKKLGIKVVEEITETDNNAQLNSVETITPVTNAPVKENVKKKKKPNYLKPEPFSLESNEEDPELLGPQSTIDTPLVRANDDVDANSTN